MILRDMSQRATSRPYGSKGASAWVRRSRASSVMRGVEASWAVPSDPSTRTPTPRFAHQRRASRLTIPAAFRIDEAAKAMGGPVVAAGAPVRTDAVVDFEGATLDDDSHAEAVGDTDAGRVGAGVGLGERRHGVGDVLGREHERLRGSGASRSRQVACGLHRELRSPGASPRAVHAAPGTLMCQGPTYRLVSAPIQRLLIADKLRLARGSGGDEQVKSLLTQVLVLRLREHCQHSCRSDGGARVRALPLVPLESGGNRLAWMNDHDGGMAAAEQDDADGVLSR